MPRDPMDELIDDLDRVVPAKEPTQWGQMPSFEETTFWTDKVLYSRPITKPISGRDRHAREGRLRGRSRLPEPHAEMA